MNRKATSTSFKTNTAGKDILCVLGRARNYGNDYDILPEKNNDGVNHWEHRDTLVTYNNEV